MNEVVVVVPIYKKELSKNEKISFCQLQRVLGKYSICLLIPKKLYSYYKIQKDFMIECFDDSCFESVTAYSRLMLSVSFYKRFLEYKFLLIYQLDAFVFSDKLLEFCHLDYDYIGAPLPRYATYWQKLNCRVGNGGFSLRKIKSAIRILEQKDYIYKEHPLRAAFEKYEDLFFAYCGSRKELRFRIPDALLAAKFSIQLSSNMNCRKLSIKLPFGCHSWDKTYFNVWKPIIEKNGYHFIDEAYDPYEMNFHESRIRHAQHYLMHRLLRCSKGKSLLQECVRSILPNFKSGYSIWGYGINGKQCIGLLQLGGVLVDKIYDVNYVESDMCLLGRTVIYPTEEKIKDGNTIIIITASKFELDISKRLCSWGIKKQSGFLLFSDIEKEILSAYYKNSTFPAKMTKEDNNINQDII